MKKLLSILAVLLPLFSCSRMPELVEPLQEDGAPDGTVSITFSCTMPESSEATKALGESGQLTSLHLAIFGSSGYYKEYVTATLLESHTGEDGMERTFHHDDGTPFTKKVDWYRFRADIKLSNTPRTIHFLGNGPKSIKIGKANEVLPKLLCNDPSDEYSGETALWQMIWVPAIRAADDGNGNYLNPQGNPRQPGEDYLVHPDTKACFGDIALIRNWAKIILRNNWKDAQPDLELDPSGNTYGFSNFIPHSFAIIHYPERGTLIPYGGKTGFIGPDEDHPDRTYQDLAFDQLYYAEKPKNAATEYDFYYGYKGNLPEGAPINHDIPSQEDFENGTGGVVLYDPTFDSGEGNDDYDPSTADRPDEEPAVYLYERPAPTNGMEPSFVIIYGLYKNPKDRALTDEEKETGVWCYYKVDLMDGTDYYPIFRNFKYQIHLRKIASRGHNTAQSAAESAGSADVSADVTASNLAEISDGKRRMGISPWMSYTYIEGDPVEDEHGNPVPLQAHLYVKFEDDVTTDPTLVNMDAASVWYTLTPEHGGVIEDDYVEIGAADTEEGDDYGWRPIKFRICQPDELVSRTQTLRIYCKTDPDNTEETPLYRDVVITLQSKQTMKVSCLYPRVLRDAEEYQDQRVDITIPDGLVESMFPLVFTIEPQEMTLAANLTTIWDGSEVSMPVVYGTSVKDPSKTRFQFERTVTWEEYSHVRTEIVFEDESRWKTFPCEFKTNCEYSATEIWVANKYFNPASCSFSDYRSFKKFKFLSSIPRSSGQEIPVGFSVSQDDGQYPVVYIRLTNLEWEGHSPVDGVYTYQPQGKDNTLTFLTTTDDGEVSVTLSAEGDVYEPATITPWRFTNVGFVDTHALHSNNNWVGVWGSNAVFGMVNKDANKNLLFAFCTDPDNPQPNITYKNVFGINKTGYNLKNSTLHTTTTYGSGGLPYSGREDFYWQEMKTPSSASTTPVSFTMSSEGYIEEAVYAERFNGNILSTRVDATNLKNWFGGGTLRKENINMNDYCKAFIEFDEAPDVSNDGLVFRRGKTYEMTIHFYASKTGGVFTDTSCELANVQLEYYTHEGIPQSHLEYEIVAPIEDGNESSFYQYMGANFQYIWAFPRHCQEGVIRIKAPNTRDAVVNVLRIWGLKDNS